MAVLRFYSEASTLCRRPLRCGPGSQCLCTIQDYPSIEYEKYLDRCLNLFNIQFNICSMIFLRPLASTSLGMGSPTAGDKLWPGWGQSIKNQPNWKEYSWHLNHEEILSKSVKSVLKSYWNPRCLMSRQFACLINQHQPTPFPKTWRSYQLGSVALQCKGWWRRRLHRTSGPWQFDMHSLCVHIENIIIQQINIDSNIQLYI